MIVIVALSMMMTLQTMTDGQLLSLSGASNLVYGTCGVFKVASILFDFL